MTMDHGTCNIDVGHNINIQRTDGESRISLDYFTYVLSARFSLSPLLRSLRLAPSSLSLSACLISLREIPFFPLFPIIHFRLFPRLSFSLDISPREERFSRRNISRYFFFYSSSLRFPLFRPRSFSLSLSSRLLELVRTSLSAIAVTRPIVPCGDAIPIEAR